MRLPKTGNVFAMQVQVMAPLATRMVSKSDATKKVAVLGDLVFTAQAVCVS